MRREAILTEVVIWMFQVAMHVGMIGLFGWLSYKVGIAHELFQPDNWSTYGLCVFAGVVAANVVGSMMGGAPNIA